MALLDFDGFSTYLDATTPLAKYAVFDAVLAEGRRASSSSAKLTAPGEIRRIVSAISEVITGFAYKQTALFATTIAQFGTAAGEQISLRTTADGQLYVSRNGTTLWTSGTNPIFRLVAGVWRYIEFKAVINTTTGSFSLKLNGLTSASVTQTGVNTAAQGGTTADRLQLLQTAAGESFFADLYLCDGTGAAPENTFLGDCRVDVRRPNAAGAHSDHGVSGAATAYDATNEAVPNADTDFIFSHTVGDITTVGVEDMPYSPSNIYGVHVVHYSKLDVAGVREVQPVARLNSSDHLGTAAALTTDYVRYELALDDNPITALPLTVSDIASMEIGVKTAT